MIRILLVDDHEPFRRALSESLRLAGYDIQCAGDGFAAVELFRRQPFDLVITDLIMPEQEGIETIMELRRIQPGLKIIAISGGGRMSAEDYLPIALQLGASAALAKPFTIEEILGAIASLFAREEIPRTRLAEA